MKILLKEGTIFTMTDKDQGLVGDVLIKDGKIAKIDSNITDLEAKVISCKGKVVLPGLIDAHSHIGVFGWAMGERGIDGNENTAVNTAELRAIDGLNPFDIEFEHAYTHGVTCVSTGPGSANPICGQFVIMKTYGPSFDERIVRAPSAMKMAFGENPKSAHNGGAPVTRMGTAAIIREALFKAKRYAADKEEAIKEGKPLPPFDMKLEALEPVIRGTLPVKAHAHRADDILTALRIAQEFNLDMSIEHCSEGHLIPESLSAASGIVIGPLMGFPHKLEETTQTPKAGKILFDHGIAFAIMSDLPASHSGDIVYGAGACVREGLPMIEALKAVTRYPAEILKISHRTGCIKVGNDADITVFSTNPVEDVKAMCLLTLIDGQIVHNELEVQGYEPS